MQASLFHSTPDVVPSQKRYNKRKAKQLKHNPSQHDLMGQLYEDQHLGENESDAEAQHYATKIYGGYQS